jgi:hypothetical protein
MLNIALIILLVCAFFTLTYMCACILINTRLFGDWYTKKKIIEKHIIHLIRMESGEICATTRMTEEWYNSLVKEGNEVWPFIVELPKNVYKYRPLTKTEFSAHLFSHMAKYMKNIK